MIAIIVTTISPSIASGQSTKVQNSIQIAFGGDVHAEYPVSKQIAEEKSVLGKAESIFKSADFAVVNLETAITEHTDKREKQYNFKSKIDLLNNLKISGIDLVTIANNHTFDYNKKGFLDTLKNLQKANLAYVGGGITEELAYDYKTVELNGIKVGFLGLAMVNGGPGSIASTNKAGTTNGWDDRKSISAVKRAKKFNDIVVVLAHWGAELEKCPRESEVKRASAWLNAGATAVIGSHPHIIQGMAKNGSKFTAYSLGNLAFYSKKKIARETGVLLLTFDKSGVIESELLPYEIDPRKGVVGEISEKEKARRAKEIEKLSNPAYCKTIS